MPIENTSIIDWDNLIKILDYGTPLFILVLLLILIYVVAVRAVKLFGNIFREKHKIEQELTLAKDTEFLKTVAQISAVVISGDNLHEKAHEILGVKVDKGFGMVEDRFEKGHNKLDMIHNILLKK